MGMWFVCTLVRVRGHWLTGNFTYTKGKSVQRPWWKWKQEVWSILPLFIPNLDQEAAAPSLSEFRNSYGRSVRDLPWYNRTDIFRSKIKAANAEMCVAGAWKYRRLIYRRAIKKMLERQNWSNSKALDRTLLRNCCCTESSVSDEILDHFTLTCRGGSWRMGHEEAYLPW